MSDFRIKLCRDAAGPYYETSLGRVDAVGVVYLPEFSLVLNVADIPHLRYTMKTRHKLGRLTQQQLDQRSRPMTDYYEGCILMRLAPEQPVDEINKFFKVWEPPYEPCILTHTKLEAVE